MDQLSKTFTLASGCNVFSQLSTAMDAADDLHSEDLGDRLLSMDCIGRGLLQSILLPSLCNFVPAHLQQCNCTDIVPAVNGVFGIDMASRIVYYKGFCGEPLEDLLSYQIPDDVHESVLLVPNTNIYDSVMISRVKSLQDRQHLFMFEGGGVLKLIDLPLEDGDTIRLVSLCLNTGVIVTVQRKLFKLKLTSTFQMIDLCPIAFSPAISVRTVSCGYEHVVMVSDSGFVFTFGGSSRGQLGLGSVDACSTPALLEDLEPLKMISAVAGGWHSLALADSGDIYGWGWNESGQVGVNCESRGHIQIVACPELVNTPLDEIFISVSAGSRHSAAVTTLGEVYTWGWNGYGQLGLGDQDPKLQPCKLKIPYRVIGSTCKGFCTLFKCAI